MSDEPDVDQDEDEDEPEVTKLETDAERLARKRTYSEHARVGIAQQIVKASKGDAERPSPNEILDLHRLESALATEEEFLELRELTREHDEDDD